MRFCEQYNRLLLGAQADSFLIGASVKNSDNGGKIRKKQQIMTEKVAIFVVARQPCSFNTSIFSLQTTPSDSTPLVINIGEILAHLRYTFPLVKQSFSYNSGTKRAI